MSSGFELDVCTVVGTEEVGFTLDEQELHSYGCASVGMAGELWVVQSGFSLDGVMQSGSSLDGDEEIPAAVPAACGVDTTCDGFQLEDTTGNPGHVDQPFRRRKIKKFLNRGSRAASLPLSLSRAEVEQWFAEHLEPGFLVYQLDVCKAKPCAIDFFQDL